MELGGGFFPFNVYYYVDGCMLALFELLHNFEFLKKN
jgi:hypothetical protein